MLIRYLLSALIICFSFLHVGAQNNPVDQLPDIDSYGYISSVYGWARNPKSDKWKVKENEIQGIDKFDNYSIISFKNLSRNYVAIIKQTEDKGLQMYDVYVLDYDEYTSQIGRWEEHTILKFPVLKHYQARLKKNDPVTKESLGLSDLSDILSHPRDYFVFQYKFEQDATVKFLFYVESCLAGECVPSGLITKKENIHLYGEIGKDTLYNTFFYKTMLKYFVAFTDSPLKK